jgi:hypothetical protein
MGAPQKQQRGEINKVRRHQKPADLKSALTIWGIGYALCLTVATVARLLNDHFWSIRWGDGTWRYLTYTFLQTRE